MKNPHPLTTLNILGAFSAVLLLAACSNVEQGTGQALGNIGSAIEHESKKVWIAPGEKSSKRDEEEDSRRY
ncbi:MAG: hypothetical protein QY326_08345 [Bdellovibrionota bacterium]|nr:MAG: hypothetical protein QY326_08345 [Bdellovibrionota bacterium]